MLELTFDSDARALYCYFTEITEGDDADEMEAPGVFLLDANGQIVGVRLDLAAKPKTALLVYAREHDGLAFNPDTNTIMLTFAPAPVASEAELPYGAIIDVDSKGRALGLEVQAMIEFDIAQRLEALQPLLVAFDEDGNDDEDDEESGIGNRESGIGNRESESEDEQEAEIRNQEAGSGNQEAERYQESIVVDDRAEKPQPKASKSQVNQAIQPAQILKEESGSQESAIRNQESGWRKRETLYGAVSVPAAPTAAPLTDEVRAGFVAIIGKPNVGKSTLLNAYLGQKISIVSPKPQTTRVPVRGIMNSPDAQIVFVDTPGIHQPRHKLGAFMVDVARKSIPNSDVLCFVVDITVPPSRQDREIGEMVRTSKQPHILVLNKVDATRNADFHLQQYRELGPWQAEVAISARDRLGLETLLEEIVTHLPRGPRLYPEDQLSDMSERELVAEMIREKVMLNTEQEIPHSVAVEVEEWEDRDKAIYIRANISVEKDSQKGIIIGAGGVMLKKIGAAARFEIERSLGQHVFLDLWVKVRDNWRQKPNELRWLGYDVKYFKG